MDIKAKRLEELTMEEWGTMFPIEMIAPQDDWGATFNKEQQLIRKTLTSAVALDIQHIGSTSIPNIVSKGSIDMLIDIPAPLLFDTQIITAMERIGYEYCIQGGYGPEYMIFAKGFNREGRKEQQYYAHMSPKSHTELWDRIFFRDYLKQHSDIATEYEYLKIKLAATYSRDRRSFRMGKTDFVTKITTLAKENKQAAIQAEPSTTHEHTR